MQKQPFPFHRPGQDGFSFPNRLIHQHHIKNELKKSHFYRHPAQNSHHANPRFWFVFVKAKFRPPLDSPVKENLTVEEVQMIKSMISKSERVIDTVGFNLQSI